MSIEKWFPCLNGRGRHDAEAPLSSIAKGILISTYPRGARRPTSDLATRIEISQDDRDAFGFEIRPDALAQGGDRGEPGPGLTVSLAHPVVGRSSPSITDG